MPARASIADTIKRVGSFIQDNAAQLAAGAAKSWLAAHREELLVVIQQAKTERGAALLEQFCKEVPLVAGAITLAMKGTPQMAILAISVYDPSLAEELGKHQANFEKLQQYWRLGAENKTS